jgi:hypothetical protein
MENREKYRIVMSVIAVVAAAFTFIMSLTCMIYYILTNNAMGIAAVVLVPFLIVCLFVFVGAALFSVLNLGSRLGKIALLINLVSAAFIITSFALLLT